VETIVELLDSVKSNFPAVGAMADELHFRTFGEITTENAFSWFESLAGTINAEMAKEVPAKVHQQLFKYINGAFMSSSSKVRECIEVAFIENLFWRVPSMKCQPYWQQLPEALRKLYRDFHGTEP